MLDYTYDGIAKMIDHSPLNPMLTDDELEAGCQTALEWGVATVCIKPYYLKRCAEILMGSAVKPTTTIGFPHGGHTTVIKIAEAHQALADGAQELDMVMNIGKVLSGDWEYVRQDIAAVVQAGHASGALVKVIFENCYLVEAQKIVLCGLCGELEVDFAKTSTGYGPGGATVEDVTLMRKHCSPQVQIKAAGGVRTLDQLLEMRAAGATRIGASRTVAILEECKARLNSQPGEPE